MAEEFSKEQGEQLLPAMQHSTLKFMGAYGCVVAPHLRPLCTLHTCDINGLGFKKGDLKWTKKYFKLREQIEIELGSQ